MKSFLLQIFALLPAILLSIIVPAQEVPVLPSDPSIKVGRLPDGMSYYIVSNGSAEGQADFALVQKTGRKTVEGEALKPVEVAKEALASPSGAVNSSLQHYMVRHGAKPGNDGFVKVSDDATVFRFSGLEIGSGTVLDSTLMVMMNLAGRYSESDDDFVGRWYVPEDQAIVIAGDVDPGSVAEKLRIMSLMVPAGESLGRPEYVWEEKPHARFVAGESDGPLATVSATWFVGRTPREYMNTAQAEVFAMSMDMLGDIACERIADVLDESHVPYAAVGYGYSDGDDSPSDNSFTIRLTVSKEDCPEAVETLSMVMASLDADGVSVGERRLAMARFRNDLRKQWNYGTQGNDGYVDRCVSAFLYGSSLTSAKERLDYHSSRKISDTTGVRLLNGIISALLDREKNLEVRVNGMADSLAVKNLFDSAWLADTSGSTVRSSAPNMNDTLSFPGPGPKVKLKSSKKDHVSGGSVWTFSNGFKVVYRNMPADGQIHYMIALNGGYGNMTDLAAGEGAFMSDFLDFSYVSGIRGKDFKDILMTEGITMDTKVHLSNLMVSGTAPREEVPLLMKALLALSEECRPADGLYGCYAAKEELALEARKGSRAARMTAIDSIMCPGYRYSGYKSQGKLSEGFFERAGRYLEGQMEKMNDGLLIIVGDIREEQLKKILLDHVGAFRTKDMPVRRTSVRYQPISGWSTYTMQGDENSIDVVMSARTPITTDTYMTAAVAAMCLRQKLSESLADTRLRLDMSHVCMIYPEDRVSVGISVSEADSDGFAFCTKDIASGRVLAMIRSALSEIAVSGIDESMLAIYKARLKNDVAAEMADPSYWTTAIALRYLDGKDMTTDCFSKIDAVTVAKVKALLSSLEMGSKVEYVIMKD